MCSVDALILIIRDRGLFVEIDCGEQPCGCFEAGEAGFDIRVSFWGNLGDGFGLLEEAGEGHGIAD